MKKNDFAEIKKMDIKAIAARVKKHRMEVLDLMLSKQILGHTAPKSSNNKLVKNKRKEIAQMLTVIRQKQLIEQLGVKS